MAGMSVGFLSVSPTIRIPDDELVERFVRASGAGGQNVNKVSSAVELRFDVAHSPSLRPSASALSSSLPNSSSETMRKRSSMSGLHSPSGCTRW